MSFVHVAASPTAIKKLLFFQNNCFKNIIRHVQRCYIRNLYVSEYLNMDINSPDKKLLQETGKKTKG